MNLKLTKIEWYACGVALFVALGFFVHQWLYPSYLYDAGQYSRMGRNIAEFGLFKHFTASALRTYGYPVFLGAVYRSASLIGLPVPILLFLLQLSIYFAACLFLRHALSRTSVSAARIAFCGLLANYYVLLYAPEPLTESVSISLLVLVGGCWLKAYQKDASAWPLVAGSLLAGIATVVRPANLFIVVAWVVGVAIIGVRRRPPMARAVMATACVVALVALPTLPQLAYNVLRFRKWTPLVAENLGTMQQAWGIRDLKYATGMPPLPEPKIHYVNPFVAGTTIDEVAPWRWYFDHPGRGALTLAIHTFNLTDQDLLFTYSRDLHPWYRVPLGVINHSVVALGVVGFVLGVRRVRAGPDKAPRDGYIMMLVTAGASWAIHVLTAVEMRFGLALLLVLTPLAGWAAIKLFHDKHMRPMVTTGVAVGTYVVLALLLSDWIRHQAPLIRDSGSARIDAQPTEHTARRRGHPVSIGDWNSCYRS